MLKKLKFMLGFIQIALTCEIITGLYYIGKEMLYPQYVYLLKTEGLIVAILFVTYMIGVTVYESIQEIEKKK